MLDAQALKRAMDEAEYLRLLDMAALSAAIERNPGRARREARYGGGRARSS